MAERAGQNGVAPAGQAGGTLGRFSALLFDMDGTILTSIAAVDRAWTAWARRVGIPLQPLLSELHGRRASETIRRFAPPGTDLAAEIAWLDAAELADTEGIAPIPGARGFLEGLPAGRWAVVTSAIRAVALGRIEAAGLPMPAVLVAAEDVGRGKPDPEGFLRAAERLGVAAAECLVFEDTAAGLEAGRAAGARVVRIAGPHAGTGDAADIPTIANYEALRLTRDPQGIALHWRS